MTQYCVGANYTWLLVEGVYLHSLLVLVGGSEGGHFRCYLLLGWGEPRPCPLPNLARLHSPNYPAGLPQGCSFLLWAFASPSWRGKFRGSWAWRGPCAR